VSSDRKQKRDPLLLIDAATETLLDSAPEEWKRGARRIKRQQEGIAKAEGFGATAPGQALARKWLPELTKGIERALAFRTRSLLYSEFLAVIRGLEPEVVSLCFLQATFDSIAQKANYRDTALAIGAAVAAECWAASLTKERPDLAKRIEKRVRQNYIGSSERRQKAARTQAARAGYRTNDWSTELRLQAGSWAIDRLLTILPAVFATTSEAQEKGGPEKFLILTPVAEAGVRESIADLIRRYPVWLPTTHKPPQWTDWDTGGTSDKRLSLSLHVMRSRSENTAEAVRDAIRNKTMQSALNALNALQSTAWTINHRVLDVLQACVETGIAVPGLPSMADLPAPEKPIEWESMDHAARYHWRRQHTDKIEQQNRKNRSNRVLLIQDLETAAALAKHERFWTPMNLDWRGRVNALPHFNLYRDDRARALFLFARGEPIGDGGLKWLKVHTANCGDFGKVSKRPFVERVRWADDNLEKIKNVAADPLKELWWTEADAPFLFLAACFELASALAKGGPAFASRLPISFDGSCSGLQHLSAMMRDLETARLVNLTPNELPQDIYGVVATAVEERVKCDLSNADKRHLAQMWLNHRIDRKLVKRNVMTYSYGSTVQGMANQLYDDTTLPLSLSKQERPFGDDNGDKASWYLAQHTCAAIKQVVNLPAQAMSFLQTLARAMARENKALRWTSPVGVPWINQYNKPDTKQIKLAFHERGVRVRYTTKVAVGELAAIDENAAKKGVAPNFVHACDAAHLLRTVNAAVSEGITSIATVHDSFGCLPSRAERFRKIIREEFVRMYEEHDVLAEVFTQARAVLSGNTKRMPSAPPQYGSLDLKKALSAEFAFA